MQPLVLFFGSTSNPIAHPLFSCVALVTSFSWDTIPELSMTLMRLSGANTFRDPLVSQFLG